MIFLHILFWMLVSTVLYVYLGYPLLLILLTKGKRNERISEENGYPTVSLIVTAFNEEKVIDTKIRNCLDLDYPKEKLQIIIASDGSTDRTNDIAKSYANKSITLINSKDNNGKSTMQNMAVENTNGDILVFSDAPSMYEPQALKKLIPHFEKEEVGCVAGRASYLNEGESAVAQGEGLYWRYETFLRKKESQLGNLAMASGWIFAVRRNLFHPLDSDVGDDFKLPLQVVRQGYQVVYEPEAVAYDTMALSSKGEFATKVRIITKDLRGLFSEKALLNPFNYPLIALGLISHKLLRWLVPYFLIGIFSINIFLLESTVYRLFFFLQVLFYLLALGGFLLERFGKKIKVFAIPFTFCVVNIASFVGVLRFLFGKRHPSWVPIRD